MRTLKFSAEEEHKRKMEGKKTVGNTNTGKEEKKRQKVSVCVLSKVLSSTILILVPECALLIIQPLVLCMFILFKSINRH